MAEEPRPMKLNKGFVGSNRPVQTKGNEPPQLPKGESGTAPPKPTQPPQPKK